MKLGNRHNLVTAYSALATVVVGLLVFDIFSRREPQQVDQVAGHQESSDSAVARLVAFVTRHGGGEGASIAIK